MAFLDRLRKNHGDVFTLYLKAGGHSFDVHDLLPTPRCGLPGQRPFNAHGQDPEDDVLDRHFWPTREDRRIAIVGWIERTYHRRRRRDTFGRLTPIEYETIMTTHETTTATQAA